VDVSFEGNIPLRTFTADVSRNAPVSEILKILDESKIHYKIEDKKIIVIP
jgi:transmembrane sensor